MAHQRYSPYGHYLAVIDEELNFIDTYDIVPYARRYSMSLRSHSDPSERSIFTSGYTSGQVFMSDAPAGW